MKGGIGSPTGVENMQNFLDADSQIRVLEQEVLLIQQEIQRRLDEEDAIRQRLEHLRAQQRERERRAGEERNRIERNSHRKSKKTKSKSKGTKNKNNSK